MKNKMKYITGGASVLGNSHKAKNKPNQDNYVVCSNEDFTIICVADGHGGDSHFRSDKGSSFAVEAALDVLKKYAHQLLGFDFLRWDLVANNQGNLELEKNIIQIKQSIFDKWKNMIEDNLKNEPFSLFRSEERTINSFVNKIDPESCFKIVEKGKEAILINKNSYIKISQNPIIAYGSTLMCLLVIKDSALILQLGDGNILFNNLETVVAPFINLEEQMANETDSLCQNDPSKMRHQFFNSVPDLITISTDGVANSFPSEETIEEPILEIRKDYLNGVDNEKIEEDLSSFLNKLTLKGSGDDCTFVYFINSKIKGKKNDSKEELKTNGTK